MAVKNMLYDAINYAGQVKDIGVHHREWDKQAERPNGSSADEFLSGFRKEDHLLPVITIVVYWGADEWDGPRCLHDMFEPGIPEEILSFVPDYRFNLLVPAETDLELYRTDLKQIFKIAKAGNDKKHMQELFHSDPAYKSIDHDAAVVINAITGMKLKIPRKEKVDMSTAAKEWAKDERTEGKAEGRAEGRAEGGFSELVELVMDGDLTLNEAVVRAKKYGITDEEDFRKRALIIGKKI